MVRDGLPCGFSGRMTRPELRSVIASAVPAETPLNSSESAGPFDHLFGVGIG